MTDSMLSRSINSISQYITNPELEICCTAWANFETIHSYSYTYILQNVVKDASAFFDSILEDQEIVKRAKVTAEAYDKLIGNPKDIKQEIFDAVMATQITEGLAFYISFACSFFFGYRGVMEGNAKIISLIARDENCLTDTAEALVRKRGWVKIKDLKPEDEIAQYNENGRIKFVKPKAIIKKPYSGKVFNFKHESGIDFTTSPDHRFIYTADGKLTECQAKDFVANHHKSIILSGIKKYGRRTIGDVERFAVMAALFGEVHYSGCVSFRGLDENKKSILFDSLENLKGLINPKISHVTNGDEHDIFITYDDKEVKISQNLFESLDFSIFSIFLCQLIIEFIEKCDASLKTTIKNAEFIQSLCLLSGRRSVIKRCGDKYVVVYNDSNSLNSENFEKTEVDYEGDLVCVSVPTGMFLARQNGAPFVTGNCHVAITQNIIDNWRKYPEEGFQKIVKENEQKIYDMYGFATETEKKWADYLFSKGSLLGLTPTSLKGYIEWLANNRLVSLGYKKIYDAPKNPIGGWLDSYMDSEKVQVAPQETEISSYKISSRKPDMQDSTFEGLTL
jgi:ribonucleotide reductase beta subunit family protein with ferritin-like domain